MLQEFNDHISARFPDLRETKLLVACSGGLDSMVLSKLLHALNISFDLAHCNFGLRGVESDKDQEFVEALAKEYESQFFHHQFEMDPKSGSIQLEARNLRYNWFDKLLNEHDYDYLLTAHHMDDGLETFLINLARGTGIEGLTGIPERNGQIVRPLLPFSREQLLNYAKKENLTWREDSSNSETKYLRNKIRHKVVPTLKDLNPIFLKSFQVTQHRLRESHEWIENQIKGYQLKLFIKDDNNFKINIKQLKNIVPLETTLYLFFKPYGFTNAVDLLALLEAESGKQLMSRTHRLLKNREHLLLAAIDAPTLDTVEIREDQSSIEKPLRLELRRVEKWESPSKNEIYVDKETLNYPLLIRKWENGDYFYPFGMEGRKKVAKFFKDEKVDILSKEKQWLLCSGNDIVWVVGRRADNRFKVTKATDHIVKITWLE
ncbi:MAG: tRNA lysidine(34) synthetase TilS [Allomuricauda sp.]|nr:MAG: tRNA lysidine(34) synthetase TilS [Allomuricauda sp.]